MRAADLFVVTREGPAPGERVTLLLDEEGHVGCDGRPGRHLDDSRLVRARGLEEDLQHLASENASLPPRPGSVERYTLREQAGTVRFSDNSAAQPRVLGELALFVLQVARDSCGVTP